MKQTVILSLVGLSLLTSCEKEYRCTCTYTPTGGTGATHPYPITAKKKDAKKVCDEVGANWISAGGTCEYR